jgi:glycosyltransferase involved in cell wall biosynthesis
MATESKALPSQKRRRVGLLVDSLVGGGAERVALNFAEKFIELGHDAHVIILRNEVEHDTGQVPVHTLSETGLLSANRVINKLLLVRRLKQAVAGIEADGKRFDFYISNAEDMDRLSGMARLPYAFVRYRNSMLKFYEAKVGESRGLKRRVRQVHWLRKFRRIYGGRHIVTVSKAMQHELTEVMGIRPASITTIYNPFGFERLRRLAEELAPVPSEPYIVYAARMSGRKAQLDLVRAYAQAQVPHKLVLLGGTTSEAERAYEAEIQAEVIALGLKDQVLFPGFATNPYPWIKHAALFAMSSLSEGLPTVLIEALILGTPVVSTDCPTGPSEILTGALARFLSPVGDTEALAQNIREALADYPTVDDDFLAQFRDDYAIEQYLEHFEALSRTSHRR